MNTLYQPTALELALRETLTQANIPLDQYAVCTPTSYSWRTRDGAKGALMYFRGIDPTGALYEHVRLS